MLQPTLSAFFNDQPDAVWFLLLNAEPGEQPGYSDFSIEYCNPAAERLAGKLNDEQSAIYFSLQRSNSPTKPGFFAQAVKACKTNTPQQHDIRIDANDLYYEVFTTAVPNGALIVSRDVAKQYQLQKELDLQVSRYQSIIDNTSDGMLLLTAIRNDANNIVDFRISHCNEAGCKLGRLPADAKGKTMLQMLPHLHGGRQFELHKHVVETGNPVQFETTFRNEKGEEYGWFIVSLQRIDEGVLSRFVDITNKKKSEEEIERQANLLTSILNSSLDSVFALEAVYNAGGEIEDFTFLKINKTFTSVVHKTEAEVIGQRYLTIFDSSRENGMFDMKRKVVETGMPVQTEVYYQGHGLDAWFRLSITKLGNNGLVQSFSDITEIKKAKERLRMIIDTSAAGMFTLTPVYNEAGEIIEFTFGLVNQAVAEYFEKPIENLAGDLVGLHHRAYHTNGLFELYKTTFQSGTAAEVDYHLEEGLDIYLAIRVNKIADELLVTFTDHTTLVKLQLQLQHYIKELKRSNESLEEFTSAASHDLKEPIRKINFLVSVLKKRQKVEEEHDSFNTFEKLELATRRMIHLVDNLLEYSHLSYKEKAKEPVDLNLLLSLVLTDLELVVEEKQALISFSNLPVISGNELQLQQLFENLLSNSLKYSKKDTPPVITLTASVIDGHKIDDERATARMYHCITITDNGIGFQQEYAEKIFKVFERLHGNYEYKGSGIGLSIVRKVAENHGGFITANGNTDVGAVFNLYLPVENEKLKNIK